MEVEGTLSIVLPSNDRFGSREVELTAHHLGLSHVPAVVTHCPPFPFMVDLHTAL